MTDPIPLRPGIPRRIRDTVYRDGRLYLPAPVRRKSALWMLGVLVLGPLIGTFVGWLSAQLGW